MSDIISLEKNQVISLSKGVNLTKGLFGLGWKPVRRGARSQAHSGQRVDLDASCLGIDANDKATEFVFFNRKIGMAGAVSLSGDDLSGANDGEGDNAPDEIITIDLDLIPDNVEQLLLIVNSFSGQTFGAVEDVFCRVTDYFTHQDVIEYDLDADYAEYTTVVVGKLSRAFDNRSEWEFTAVGKGINSGLKALLASYGLRV